MAATKEYLYFVLEQLSGIDGVSYRAMMGEYIFCYRGKVFGGLYDDRLLVKPVPAAVKLMPDAELELPYDGGLRASGTRLAPTGAERRSKEMLLVDDIDNREFLCELVRCMWEDLPDKKKKK